MEFEYSPRHSPGNAAHLLSPTHAHRTSIDGFASIREIRRSLSRSPSKPARYSYVMHSPKSPTAPRSPHTANAPTSPSLLSRAYSADTPVDAPKPRPSVKRNSTLRVGSRRTSPTNSLRRALSDNTNQANAVPRTTRRRSSEEGQENMAYTTATPKPQESRFDDPIRLDFSKAGKHLQPAKQEHASPMKSSPLKRSDGVMNLEAASMGSPRSIKRRSLGAPLGSDFNVFDQGFDGAHGNATDSAAEKDAPSENGAPNGFGSPAQHSPQRRPLGLRKSTLQQRAGPARARLFPDSPRESHLNPTLNRARSRISLDGSLPMRSFDMESPFKRSNAAEPPVFFQPPSQKQHQSAPKPHPLSHALTPSSSNSNMVEDMVPQAQTAAVPNFSKPQVSMPPPSFARSLPVGPARVGHASNQAIELNQSSQESFGTPDGYRMARPAPQAFMSTGLISKRHRNVEMNLGSVHMPDTPSKKAHMDFSATPAPLPGLGKVAQPSHEFGSPSTPFGMRSSKISPESFGKNVNIFGARVGAPQLTRRGSFISLDGEDINPSSTHRLESQSSNDDLPPTPTKSASTNARPQSKGKSNSLRSSLFGRRASIGPDTFASPAPADNTDEMTSKSILFLSQTPSAKAEKGSRPPDDGKPMPFITLTGSETPTPSHSRTRSLEENHLSGSPSPLAKRSQRSLPVLPHQHRHRIPAKRVHRTVLSPAREEGEKSSPHTPQDHFAPPDPSSLSISAAERPRTSLGSSTNAPPPATPTGPRDNGNSSGFGAANQSSSYFANDVDTSLTSRFGQVSVLGTGEFSQVYRVEKPVSHGLFAAQQTPGRLNKAWAVKKSRKQYTGNKDRQRKMREVEVLKALRGQEHLIEFVDAWEAKNHLYIQTDFYENGNLQNFLQHAGYKGRVDDFRIWKVLLELTQGIKSIHDAGYIHLDLKPANVFIDWEGCLKIGDFGLASTWPAPPNLDGEGDREYIGPEVLHGRFDRPADIFSLGMIMLEIAGNIVLPDNGASWRRLRDGDLSDLPSLTWSSDSLVRDESGDPVELLNGQSAGSLCASTDGDDDLAFLRTPVPKVQRVHELVKPPHFMVHQDDPDSLDRVVQWLVSPNPDHRPNVDQLLQCGGVQWVERRRRAGATVYEGAWGPAEEVLEHEQDVEMMDM